MGLFSMICGIQVYLWATPKIEEYRRKCRIDDEIERRKRIEKKYLDSLTKEDRELLEEAEIELKKGERDVKSYYSLRDAILWTSPKHLEELEEENRVAQEEERTRQHELARMDVDLRERWLEMERRFNDSEISYPEAYVLGEEIKKEFKRRRIAEYKQQQKQEKLLKQQQKEQLKFQKNLRKQ